MINFFMIYGMNYLRKKLIIKCLCYVYVYIYILQM